MEADAGSELMPVAVAAMNHEPMERDEDELIDEVKKCKSCVYTGVAHANEE